MYKELHDKEWLQEHYDGRQMTLQEVADVIGCNKASVHRAMDRYGLKRRTRTSKYPKLNDKVWLENAYVNEGRSLNDISREVGSTPGNVATHLDTLGIERRTITEAIKVALPNGRQGENGTNWKGGRKKANRDNYYYRYAPDHPNATKQGYVMEHRLIAENILGRYLKKNEIVHHIDGDKSNNDPNNLEVLTRSEHVMRHFEAVSKVRRLKKQVAQLTSENEKLREEISMLRNSGG